MSVTRLSVPISSKMRYSLSSENDGGQEGLALLQPGQHTSTSEVLSTFFTRETKITSPHESL